MLAGLYRPRALNPCGASRRTGTCGGAVLVLGVRLELTLAFLLREWLLPIERPELDSPCLLVKGTDCAGDVLPVWGVVICRSSRVLFRGSHGSLVHVNVAVRTCPVLCGVPRGFGGDYLPHIPATRAMFAYPRCGEDDALAVLSAACERPHAYRCVGVPSR